MEGLQDHTEREEVITVTNYIRVDASHGDDKPTASTYVVAEGGKVTSQDIAEIELQAEKGWHATGKAYEYPEVDRFKAHMVSSTEFNLAMLGFPPNEAEIVAQRIESVLN